MMRNRRGVGLVDAVVALLLLALAGVLFSATFPTGLAAVRQSGETKKAVALVEQKIEQVKALGFESLSYSNLRAANVVDAAPTDSPYAFTSVDSLSSNMAGATGKLVIDSDAPGVKRVTVSITWKGGAAAHDVTIRTLVADTRPWRRS